MEKIKEQRCKTCKYFSQHYAISDPKYQKFRKNKYITVCCGHCLNTQKTKKHITPLDYCALFEQIPPHLDDTI